MKKKNLIAFGIFIGVLSCMSLPCFATDYNVTQYSGNDNSLTNRQTSFQSGDSATLVNDITADGNITSFGGDITFTLNGKDSNGVSHTISGNNTYSDLIAEKIPNIR